MIEIQSYWERMQLLQSWSEARHPMAMSAFDDLQHLRKHVDRCSTLFWARSLKRRHSLTSARATQRFFAPDSIKRGAGTKPHDSNIFSKYLRGLHKPNIATLRKVEIKSPGSSAPTKLLIWDVLSRDQFTHNITQRLLKRLPPDIQLHIFYKDAHGRPRREAEYTIYKSLSGRYDLSVFTAYTILAREAIYKQNWPSADLLAQHLFLAFIGIFDCMQQMGIVEKMFEIYESLIFSRTVIASKKYREMPEWLIGPYGDAPLSGVNRRMQILSDYGSSPNCPLFIQYDDGVFHLNHRRTRELNVYRGLPTRNSSL